MEERVDGQRRRMENWLLTARKSRPADKMKVETCAFSQRKIYPSKGKLYVRGDSKVR